MHLFGTKLKRRMKRVAGAMLSVACLSGSSIPATADFNAGVDAYNQGDYVTAFAEFKLAAEQGMAQAQYNLAVMYDEGSGVDQNFPIAAQLYKLAADQGYVPAQYNLAVMYESGSGVEQDDSQAATWYRKAADRKVLIDARALVVHHGKIVLGGWAELAARRP